MGRLTSTILIVLTVLLAGCTSVGSHLSLTGSVFEEAGRQVQEGPDDREDDGVAKDTVVPKSVGPENVPGSKATLAPAYDPVGSERTLRDWAELDAAVASMGPVDSIDSLVRELRSLSHDDWDRARCVYTWLVNNVAYDADAFFSGSRAVTDAEGVFRTRRSVCQGYSELFVRIASDLGLDARVISGYAKGYSYDPGERFDSTNHAWNAVCIDGAWHLFDATWGAGHVDGRRFVRDISYYYFDTPPDLFLRTHLPQDPSWQIARDPITKATYEAEDYIPSFVLESLFDMGFGDEALLNALRTGAGFPDAYGSKGYAVQVAEAPVCAAVSVGRPVTVRIRAASPIQGSLINNRSFNEMERDGEYLVGTVVPERGSLSVCLRYDPGQNTYWSLLEYAVRD